MVNPIALKVRAKKLGVLIKDARLAAGKSMKDCAEAIGISSRKMGAFERGEKSPSLPELEVLAFFLDVPLKHFWGQNTISTNIEERFSDLKMKRLVLLREKIVNATLKQARIEANLSMEELATSVGLTTEVLKSYESGEDSIPLPLLEGMASQLNVPIESFRDEEGIVGKWATQQEAIQQFLDLPAEMQNFVTKPVNKPYLEIAERLSGMSVEKLRGLAEGLLDITL